MKTVKLPAITRDRLLQADIGKEVVSQHNALHDTNIEPSLDDYVFMLTIKRIK